MFASYFNHNTIMHDEEHPQEESFSPKLHVDKVVSLQRKPERKKTSKPMVRWHRFTLAHKMGGLGEGKKEKGEFHSLLSLILIQQ